MVTPGQNLPNGQGNQIIPPMMNSPAPPPPGGGIPYGNDVRVGQIPTPGGGGTPYGNDGVAQQIPSGMQNAAGPGVQALPPGATVRPDGRVILADGSTQGFVPHSGGGGAPGPNTAGGGLNPAAGSPGPNPFRDPLPPRYQAMVAAGQPESAVRSRWAQFIQGQLPAQNGVPGAPGPNPVPPPGSPGASPPAGAGPTPAPPPPQQPGPPVFGPAYGGGYGGGQMPGYGAPPGYGQDGGYQSMSMPDNSGGAGPGQDYGYDDPISQVMAAIPAMNLNAQQQISGAMANAGFTGNRWGSAAMNQAGQIGSQNALQQNQMLTSALFDQANREQDRSLAAAQGSTALGGLLDQMAQNRLTTPFAIGQYEQGRQDNFANQAFQDWQQNKLGWFPYLLQAAASQGAGYPGQVVPNTTPGTPGLLDYAQGLGGLAGLIGSFFGGDSGGG